MPSAHDEHAALLWLMALIPAFLLAYYKGWHGVTLSTAMGMAALSLTHVVLSSQGRVLDNTSLILIVMLFYLGISLGIGYFSELLRRERMLAEQRALTDDLTQLPNRRYGRLFLDRAFAAAQRGFPLTIVAFDLDHFRSYNEEQGHPGGDEALRVFGGVLASLTRKADLSVRVGGEEFISILCTADRAGGAVFAQKIRDELARVSRLLPAPITVSIGVAAYSPEIASADALLALADRALYQAKAGGRDGIRVALHDGTIASPEPLTVVPIG